MAKTLVKYSLQKENDPLFSILEETDDNFFVTGRAGTGKSTLLRDFVQKTRKNVVVLAPTGLAAVQVEGQTIHSFFRLPPGIISDEELDKERHDSIYKNVDTLIIDEISMVRADLFDAMDRIMRRCKISEKPFGGTQLILFGDMFQLPPVAGPQEKAFLSQEYESLYFFGSSAFEALDIAVVELSTVFRQKDEEFIGFLDRVRTHDIEEDDIEYINQRAVYSPKERVPDNFVILATKNFMVDAYNRERLNELLGNPYTYDANFSGEFKETEAPTEISLTLKKGARVIFLRNDKEGMWVNGSLGTITELNDHNVEVKLDDSEYPIKVRKTKWTKSKYKLSKKKIITEETGSFEQLPLRLAWAMTIHKSQGQTIEKLFLDLTSAPWEHGHVYVALSRCRSINGLLLRQRLSYQDIIVDPSIIDFFTFLSKPIVKESLTTGTIRISGMQEDALKDIYLRALDNFQKLGYDYSPDFRFNGNGEFSIKENGRSRCGLYSHFRDLVEQYGRKKDLRVNIQFFDCNIRQHADEKPGVKGWYESLQRKLKV
ncbi:MAG: AAA family ATPase [Candidatus Woesearchaeota archaeon]